MHGRSTLPSSSQILVLVKSDCAHTCSASIHARFMHNGDDGWKQFLTPHSHDSSRAGNSSNKKGASPAPSEDDRFSTPELVSPPSSPRRNSSSPTNRPQAAASGPHSAAGASVRAGQKKPSATRAFQRYRSPPREEGEADEEVWDVFGGGSKGEEHKDVGKPQKLYTQDSDNEMPSDLRPSLDRYHDTTSHEPLLSSKDGGQHPAYDSPPRPPLSRRSTAKFSERDPELEARQATRKRYTYASFFLLLSLISFAVQTETAVYIQSKLHWEKAYCML